MKWKRSSVEMLDAILSREVLRREKRTKAQCSVWLGSVAEHQHAMELKSANLPQAHRMSNVCLFDLHLEGWWGIFVVFRATELGADSGGRTAI